MDDPDLLPPPDLAAVLGVRADRNTYISKAEVSLLTAEGRVWREDQILVEIRHVVGGGLAVGYAFMSGDVPAQLERLRKGRGFLSLSAAPGITFGMDRYQGMVAVVGETVA